MSVPKIVPMWFYTCMFISFLGQQPSKAFDKNLMRGAAIGGTSYLVGASVRFLLHDKDCGASFLLGSGLSAIAAGYCRDSLKRGLYPLAGAAIYQVQQALYQLNTKDVFLQQPIPLKESFLLAYGVGAGWTAARSQEKRLGWRIAQLAPLLYGVMSSWRLPQKMQENKSPFDLDSKSAFTHTRSSSVFSGNNSKLPVGCDITKSFYQLPAVPLYTTVDETPLPDGARIQKITLYGKDREQKDYKIADFSFDLGKSWKLHTEIASEVGGIAHLWILMSSPQEHSGLLTHVILHKNFSSNYNYEIVYENQSTVTEWETFGSLSNIKFDTVTKKQQVIGERSVRFVCHDDQKNIYAKLSNGEFAVATVVNDTKAGYLLRSFVNGSQLPGEIKLSSVDEYQTAKVFFCKNQKKREFWTIVAIDDSEKKLVRLKFLRYVKDKNGWYQLEGKEELEEISNFSTAIKGFYIKDGWLRMRCMNKKNRPIQQIS